MTIVFFLFLFHLGLGVLATLPFIPDRARRSFFKFSSASAAFTMAAGLGLLLRRYGLAGPESATAGTAPGGLLAAAAASVACAVVYNRAWHFSWKRLQGVLLAGALVFGAIAVALSAPPADRWLSCLTDLTSILLLGAATSAMVLGHWYLVVLDLPITALRRLTVLRADPVPRTAVVWGWCSPVPCTPAG